MKLKRGRIMKNEVNIKVFSTPTCPYCEMEKEFLKKHGIKFESIDVSSDRMAAAEMILKSGQRGVPVTIIEKNGEEEIIVGFDQQRLKKALGIR